MMKNLRIVLFSFLLLILAVPAFSSMTLHSVASTGCDFYAPIKFSQAPEDLTFIGKDKDFQVYLVTGNTAWSMYKAGLRRENGPFEGSDDLPGGAEESADHTVIIDYVNHFIFILQVTV